LVDQYPDKVLIGETDDASFLGNGSDELHLIFNFQLMRTSSLSSQWIRRNQYEQLKDLPQGPWLCNTLGNHDSSRVASRFAANNQAILPLLAAIPILLPGTPFLYYGEEIGMTDNTLISMEEFKDQLAIWMYQTEINFFDTPPAKAFEAAALYGRDKCRTPMQWNRQPNAGFCSAGVLPWLPLNPNYIQDVNVETQRNQANSLWHTYQSLINWRKSKPSLSIGKYEELEFDQQNCFAFLRKHDEDTCLVALNMSNQNLPLNLKSLNSKWRCLFSTIPRNNSSIISEILELFPFEVFIAELII
jgi:alpha-glucosidase